MVALAVSALLMALSGLGTLIYLWKDLKGPATRWIDAKTRALNSIIQAAEEQAKPKTEPAIEYIPQELYDRAMSWSDPWARDQALQATIELKERFKTWERVSAHIGTGGAS